MTTAALGAAAAAASVSRCCALALPVVLLAGCSNCLLLSLMTTAPLTADKALPPVLRSTVCTNVYILVLYLRWRSTAE